MITLMLLIHERAREAIIVQQNWPLIFMVRDTLSREFIGPGRWVVIEAELGAQRAKERREQEEIIRNYQLEQKAREQTTTSPSGRLGNGSLGATSGSGTRKWVEAGNLTQPEVRQNNGSVCV